MPDVIVNKNGVFIDTHVRYRTISDNLSKQEYKFLLTTTLTISASTIIEPAALAAAHSFTQGNPRLIDNLMTDALTIGFQQDRKVIDAETIRAAVDNQGLY